MDIMISAHNSFYRSYLPHSSVKEFLLPYYAHRAALIHDAIF